MKFRDGARVMDGNVRPLSKTEKEIQKLSAQHPGVTIRVVCLRKGPANCSYPGCYRVRPVFRNYCCDDHAPSEAQ